MIHLEDLIAEYCPDGVEYRELQEIFTIRNGYTPSKKESTYWENGTIPWFRMEDIRLNGRVLYDSLQHITPRSVKGSLFPANSIIISTLATIGLHALIKNDFLANQQFTCLTRKTTYENRLIPEFISYYCFILAEWCQNNINVSGFASVDMSAFKKFLFPLPPIPVQEEIVRILDTFTALEAELEAELKARILQYEHYRANLLDFNPDNPNPTRTPHLTHLLQTLCPDGVEYQKLGDLGNFYGGLTGKTKSDFQDGNCKFISYMNVYKNPAIDINIKDFVKVFPGERQNSVKFGDVLFTGSSETPEECGISSVMTHQTEEQFFMNSFSIGFRLHNPEIIIPQFSKHLFRSVQLRKQINKTANGVTRFNVSKEKLANVIIPVPPLPIQEEIVAILDRFEALVSDLKDGLPAEIAARRKQYEHYRNQLLIFKPLT